MSRWDTLSNPIQVKELESIQTVQLKTRLQVDDIICHLDGSIDPALCQERFESCADIVIPHSMQIPLADPETPHDETATSVPPSDLSPFLFLLGLADMAEDGDHGTVETGSS